MNLYTKPQKGLLAYGVPWCLCAFVATFPAVWVRSPKRYKLLWLPGYLRNKWTHRLSAEYRYHTSAQELSYCGWRAECCVLRWNFLRRWCIFREIFALASLFGYFHEGTPVQKKRALRAPMAQERGKEKAAWIMGDSSGFPSIMEWPITVDGHRRPRLSRVANVSFVCSFDNNFCTPYN